VLTRREFLCGTMVTAAGAALPNLAWGETAPGEVEGAGSLRAHAAAHGLQVGCAVQPRLLVPVHDSTENIAYSRLVRTQAGIVVAENAMKWDALRPAPDRFSFGEADALFRFAEANGQLVRGHNLVWHLALPAWFESTATRDNARSLLAQHIATVAGRYAGRVHSWDVVNEAVEPDDGRSDALRRTPWLELIGPKYLELAYRLAHRADPRARLTYNDFGIELDTPPQIAKRACVLRLLRKLKARGVPLHALGVQSHFMADGPRPGRGLKELVRECAGLGVEVYITELDVNDSALEGTLGDRDRAVAAVYRDYLQTMLAEPNVKMVLTWGITDRYTWLNSLPHGRPDGRKQRPLPFDEDYQPALAYFALRDALDMHVCAGCRRSAP